LQSTPDQAATNAKLASPLAANMPAPTAQPAAASAPMGQQPLGPMPGGQSQIQLTPEMLLQLYNRDRSEQMFYRGLAGLSGALYPGRNPQGNALLVPPSQDPGQLFSEIAKLQTYQQQMGSRQALWNQLPQIAKDNDITLDQAKSLFLTDPESLNKLTLQQAGFGSGPVAQQKFDVRTYQKQNPGAPIPSYMQGPNAQYQTTAKDVAAEQNNFDKNVSVLHHVEDLATALHDGPYAAPLKSALDKWTARSQEDQNSMLAFTATHLIPPGWGGLTSDEAEALNQLRQLNALKTQAAAEIGGGRRAQQITKTMAGGFTQTGNLSSGSGPIMSALDDVRNWTRKSIADLHGAAGYLSTMDPQYEGSLSKEYQPGQPGYRGGALPSERGETAPAAAPSAGGGPADLRSSKDPSGDYAKVPPGGTYIAPDGTTRTKR
jgi:hypothetical protein